MLATGASKGIQKTESVVQPLTCDGHVGSAGDAPASLSNARPASQGSQWHAKYDELRDILGPGPAADGEISQAEDWGWLIPELGEDEAPNFVEKIPKDGLVVSSPAPPALEVERPDVMQPVALASPSLLSSGSLLEIDDDTDCHRMPLPSKPPRQPSRPDTMQPVELASTSLLSSGSQVEVGDDATCNKLPVLGKPPPQPSIAMQLAAGEEPSQKPEAEENAEATF